MALICSLLLRKSIKTLFSSDCANEQYLVRLFRFADIFSHDVKITETSSSEPQRELTYLLTSALNEDSNQPAHPHSLISVFVICMKKRCLTGCPTCVQWRFWSNCANAQADLNLRWVHISEGTFSWRCSPEFFWVLLLLSQFLFFK